MSCYLRHIKGILANAGIEVNPGNRKQIDQAIHRIVDTNYKDCPGTWRSIKQQIITDKQKRQDFVEKLRKAIT